MLLASCLGAASFKSRIRSVDRLNLTKLGFDGAIPEATGRPSYHPSALLKLYIYGYLNRVQSSRRLEREAGRNLEVIWLLRRLTPDDKTIADFRKDNGPAIKKGMRAVRRAMPANGLAHWRKRGDRRQQIQGGQHA
jgi:transposase